MANEDITQDSKGKVTKILLIEDSPPDVRLFQEWLKQEPGLQRCQFIIAETGEEGLEKAKAEKPDLVMVDTMLPGMDGFEVCRQIKNIKGLNTKVIIYTGYIDAVNVTKARLAGADDYEVKTEGFGKLLSAIEKVFLRERERERERERDEKKSRKKGGRVSIVKTPRA